jgi:hypothetical protein
MAQEIALRPVTASSNWFSMQPMGITEGFIEAMGQHPRNSLPNGTRRRLSIGISVRQLLVDQIRADDLVRFVSAAL